jgi:hypothetical protein
MNGRCEPRFVECHGELGGSQLAGRRTGRLTTFSSEKTIQTGSTNKIVAKLEITHLITRGSLSE